MLIVALVFQVLQMLQMLRIGQIVPIRISKINRLPGSRKGLVAPA
jgi:hypothetical protein